MLPIEYRHHGGGVCASVRPPQPTYRPSKSNRKGDGLMRSSRWQTFNPMWNQLQQFQSEMNRLFDRWNGTPNPLTGVLAFPAVNVWEEQDQVYVEAELPGMDLKDL